MRKPFEWVRSLFGANRVELALFSPAIVHDRSRLVRYAVAGGTLVGMVAAAAIGAAALAALMAAMAAIYFLATQVLGIKVNVDPAAFYQTVQRQANAYGAN